MVGTGRLAVLAAGAVVSWAVTPWVAMAARGTVDSRHRDDVRRLGTGIATPMPDAWRTVPAQTGTGSDGRPARTPSGTQDVATHPAR